jgi:EPS-associated MarR family transcriptional regulator
MVLKVRDIEDIHFRVLRLLEANPTMQQRELADELGVSLGKTNYCLRALLDKGMLKMHNFQSSRRKLAYAKFVEQGEQRRTQAQHGEEYSSHNTTRLDVPGMKALLLKLPFMQRIARGEQVVAED